MTENFGILQLTEYIEHMGLKIAHTNLDHQVIELAFHGDHGQWRMIIGLQQDGEAKKLMLIAPHVGTVTTKKRLECLEALMAVNYRIAIGKFGLDLEDGEVRLEETIPVANNSLSIEQFQLAFGAIIQTVAIYQSLLPRIVYGGLSVQEALEACEQDFLNDSGQEGPSLSEPLKSREKIENEKQPELDVNDVLAEVTRLFEERKD